MRRLIHKSIATECVIYQPHLGPNQPTSLDPLPLHAYSAVTRLDLSQCLDWIQHPSLRTLADLSALAAMPQLKSVDFRPLLDHIDTAKSFRIKSVSGVLCWADGMMLRIWDRWKLAPATSVSGLFNVERLADLPNLESVTFPITERYKEDSMERLNVASRLQRLTHLTLGRAKLELPEAQEVLQAATSLRHLSLGKCSRFTEAELEVLADLPNLEVLYMHGCSSMKLRNARAWEPLTKLQHLTELGLYGRAEGENVQFWSTDGMDSSNALPLKPEGENSPAHVQTIARLCLLQFYSRPTGTTSLVLSSEVPVNTCVHTGLETLCNLTQLQELRLGGCRDLNGRALLALTSLIQLTCLELKACPHLASIVLPALVENLTCLQRLQLRKLRGDHLEEQLCTVSRLNRLRTLSIDECSSFMPAPDAQQAEVLPAEEAGMRLLQCIRNLTMLEGLQLWQNNANCMNFSGCTVLSTLQLLTRVSIVSEQCMVGDALLQSIAQLVNLRALELRKCVTVQNSSLQHFSKLSSLQNLDMHEAPLIGDEGIEHIAGCTHLLSFRIMKSNISDKSLKIIKTFSRLRNLSLKDSQNLKDEGVTLLPALTSLKILDLAGCILITDQGLQHLAVMGELRQLNLERCQQITNDGVQRFRKQILAAGPPGFSGSGGIIVFF